MQRRVQISNVFVDAKRSAFLNVIKNVTLRFYILHVRSFGERAFTSVNVVSNKITRFTWYYCKS